MATLAERCIEARKSTGMRAGAYAKKVGISHTALAKIEKGETRELKGTTAAGMERVSGYNSTWLTTEEGAREKAPSFENSRFAQLSGKEKELAVKMLISELGPEERLSVLKHLLSDKD